MQWSVRFRCSLIPALTGVLLCMPLGCGGKPPIEPQRGHDVSLLPAEIRNSAEMIRQDPVAYLRRVAERCRALEQYTLTFTRHERQRFFRVLYGPEHIACWFRREPFSIRMKWLDEDIKYGESVYVEGQADDKVRFVTRWWTPPLLPPPAVNKIALTTPVIWGEAKRPMTDFGLERMMDRTLAALDEAGPDVVVNYEGVLQLPDDGPIAHHIHIEHSGTRFETPIQELYIDVATDLPAGTVLKLRSGAIDAAYYYADVNADVALTDRDFKLSVELADDEQHSPAGAGEQ